MTTLTVISPGLHTLIVDHGRPRTRSLGVPVGGAADQFALAIGNALVGNPPDAAAMEISLAGPTLLADAPLACVLWGAPFEMRTDRRELTAGTTFTLEPGEQLRIGGTAHGVRAYLCIRGGIDAPMVLGSRSSLEPIQAGQTFTCQPGTIGRRWVRVPRWGPNHPLPHLLRVLPGAQASWFPTDMTARSYQVTPASNRMGIRLHGEPLPMTGREMVSEPVCPGTVQVTRDGQCIILGVDGQTIGGYPKLAQVISADLDHLGQLRPGDEVRFESVTLEEAESLYRERAAELRKWVTRVLS